MGKIRRKNMYNNNTHKGLRVHPTEKLRKQQTSIWIYASFFRLFLAHVQHSKAHGITRYKRGTA